MYHTARGLAPSAANGCTGFPSSGSATRFSPNLLRRPGYLGNGLQYLVNRFR